MPTYDYRCSNGHDFEQFYRKISDAVAEVACPACGAPAERIVSGGAGLVFKGSGFYLTDYGKNAHRKSGPDSGGVDSKGGAGESKSGGSEASSKAESSPAKADTSAPKSDAAKNSESKPSPTKKGGDTR